MISFIATIIIVSSLASTIAVASEFTGKPRIIDGDSLEISRKQIRIHGIDAPESKQTCRDRLGEWRCGFEATNALAFLVAKKWVTCIQRDIDRYGRIVATCYAGGVGGLDIGRQMVLDGWALAYRKYSKDYVDQEEDARSNGRGLWQSKFIRPWKWRRGERLE